MNDTQTGPLYRSPECSAIGDGTGSLPHLGVYLPEQRLALPGQALRVRFHALVRHAPVSDQRIIPVLWTPKLAEVPGVAIDTGQLCECVQRWAVSGAFAAVLP